jgi:hypothetical protein
MPQAVVPAGEIGDHVHFAAGRESDQDRREEGRVSPGAECQHHDPGDRRDQEGEGHARGEKAIEEPAAREAPDHEREKDQ